jgi:hypothetical protein
VVEDRVLDLRAVHVLTAAQHHVLGAVHEVDEAVLVEVGDITGVQPAIDDGLGGRVSRLR